jgi:hypothetical protein
MRILDQLICFGSEFAGEPLGSGIEGQHRGPRLGHRWLVPFRSRPDTTAAMRTCAVGRSALDISLSSGSPIYCATTGIAYFRRGPFSNF